MKIEIVYRSEKLNSIITLQHEGSFSCNTHIQDKYTSMHRHNEVRAKQTNKHTPWPESASELYRPSDSRLSAKLVPAFAAKGCHVVNVTDLYGRILGFLNRSRHFFFQVAPQLHS
jgi:hypothetical protein